MRRFETVDAALGDLALAAFNPRFRRKLTAPRIPPHDYWLTLTRCKSCGRTVPDYDVINVGSVEAGYRHLCTKCFNTEVAESDGLDGFEHAELAPVELTDCEGEFTYFISGRWMRSRFATEVRRAINFRVIGEPENDPLVLLARLIERIRRALSISHIKLGSLGLQIVDRAVRGRIEWDEAQDGRVPLLNVDGREITWDEFGRLLMSFEGWQFKFEFRDMSEEF